MIHLTLEPPRRKHLVRLKNAVDKEYPDKQPTCPLCEAKNVRKLQQTSLISIFLALIGCGGRDASSSDNMQPAIQGFAGHWTGSVTYSEGICSGGSMQGPNGAQLTMNITDIGNNQLSYQSSCGDIVFQRANNTALQLGPVTCPSVATPSGSESETVYSTTLTLNANTLQVDFIVDFMYDFPGMPITCSGIQETGILTPAPN